MPHLDNICLVNIAKVLLVVIRTSFVQSHFQVNLDIVALMQSFLSQIYAWSQWDAEKNSSAFILHFQETLTGFEAFLTGIYLFKNYAVITMFLFSTCEDYTETVLK